MSKTVKNHLRLVPHIRFSEIGGLISAVDQGQSSTRAKQHPGFEPRSCFALIEDWPCFLPALHKEKDRNARFLLEIREFRIGDSRISGRIPGQNTARIFDFWM